MLHPRRRREVADWGGVVIEDDYDGEFRYDRQPVGALQTLAPDHVIYAGTASKSLAPSLRLGWLVVPPRLLDAVTAELAAGPSALDQLTLAEFITSGAYDRQIRRARLAYRRRRDRLAAALRRQGLRVTGIAAGMHAVLDLPRTSLEHAALSGASEHGVAIDVLGHYRAGGTGPDDDGHRPGHLVTGYAARPSTPTPRPWPGCAPSWPICGEELYRSLTRASDSRTVSRSVSRCTAGIRRRQGGGRGGIR
jgi:GntR family transcriptional regulator/MocR family aminotransferase